jgi:hypothetical protein
MNGNTSTPEPIKAIHRSLKNLAMLALFAAVVLTPIACGDSKGNSIGNFTADEGGQQSRDEQSVPQRVPDSRMEGDRLHGIWPQVWSQHAPSVASWEYKVNCKQARSHTESCFLSDLTSVTVESPGGVLTELEKDFNTNEYSGEVTRRWVKYGPSDGELPIRGDYVFRYWRGEELAYEQAIPYASDPISYPTGVTWERVGSDMKVSWSPPPGVDETMHYKSIIWQVDDTPPAFVSQVAGWDATSDVLKDVPLLEGGSYSLNVAVFFADGYAYSEYVIFTWPEQ